MGFSVSGSYLILALAVLIAVATMFTVAQNAAETVTEGLGDQYERSGSVAEIDISILESSYSIGDSELVISVKNTGNRRLSVERTNILVDGRYISLTAQNTSISGERETRVWARGETLRINVTVQSPDRAKVVTEYGIAAVSPVKAFSLTNNIVYTNATSPNEIQLLGPGETVTSLNETAQVIGSPVTEFGSESVTEVPAVDSNNNLFLVDENGERTQLATNADSSKSRVAAGQWQGSDPSVFFVRNDDVVRATADGTTTTLSADTPIAKGVAGIADFDGDGADELIYGESFNSDDTVAYIDDDGSSRIDTGTQYGSNNGIGLGEPADFDGDGKSRVPVVDSSQNVQLVDENGNTELIDGRTVAAKAPLGTADLDTDGDPEVYFVNESSNLEYVDDVTGNNTVRAVTDGQSNPVSADDDAGAA
jgi:flagellar protein FlaF